MVRGPEAVRAALVEAAAEAFAFEGDVSVRVIAERAGVNHGLVHHYFGGKDGLRRAVLGELAAAQARALAGIDSEDPIAMARGALAAARADERFWRVLARALLDGEVPQPFQHAYPVVKQLIATLSGQGVDDARRNVALGLALSLGWSLFEPWIRAATGLSAAEAKTIVDDAIEQQLAS
jgi:AcrR family transcriptional regulator